MAESSLMGKTVLGGYVVTEFIGSGAFGTVYKAIKKNPSGEYVRALKHMIIPSEKQYASVFNSMGGDLSKIDNYFSEMLKSIVTEIQILNDFSEKGVQNIVRYYENDIITIESPRRYNVFILMEYLTPLPNYISQTNFTVKDVVQLGTDVLKALKLCHDNNVIHRDIKDDNIFVSANGEFKVGDFGVSKVLKDSSKAESIKGTPNFLAPEVYLGKEGYTKSADLYSLGIVLYRLLNYSRNPFMPHFPEPFEPRHEERAFDERMKGSIPGFPPLGGNLIGGAIVKAIANRNERYSSAMEFHTALETAAKGTSRDILNTRTVFSEHKTIPANDNASHSETKGDNVYFGALNPMPEGESVRRHDDLFSTGGKKDTPGGETNKIQSDTSTASNTNEGIRKKIVIIVLLLAVVAVGSFFVGRAINSKKSDDQKQVPSIDAGSGVVVDNVDEDTRPVLVEMENNETAAIAGLATLGSAQASYSKANSGRYTSISNLVRRNLIDSQYEAPFDGYKYVMSITAEMPETVPTFGEYGVFIATPIKPGHTGRYIFGLGRDMVVRYMGLAEGVTADPPICGKSPCKPGDALGKTQPPAPPAAPIRINLTAGTPFNVSASSDISTKTARKGDEFDAVLSEDITSGGHVVAKQNSMVKGVISNVDTGGVIKGPATLSIQITRLTLADGQTVSVKTNEHKVEGNIAPNAAAIGIEAALEASRGATGSRNANKADIGKLVEAQPAPAVVAREVPITFRLTSSLTVTMKK